MRGALCHVAGDNRGTSALEFALLLPVFLLLFFGAIEFGRMIWTQVTLQQAVQAAARCVSVGSCTVGDAPSYASQQTYGLDVSSGAFTATSPSCGIEVSANLPFTFILSALFPWSVTLTAQSCYPMQS
jgi:Flp pilus assembly protein TadG